MRILVLACLFVSSVAFADDSFFRIKDHHLGQGLSEFTDNKSFVCRERDDSLLFDKHCLFIGTDTIAGARIKLMFMMFIMDKVAEFSIAFGSADYLRVSNAMFEKFGTGKKHEFIVENALGATFKNEKIEWAHGDETMSLTKHSYKLGESMITIRSMSKESVDASMKRREQKSQENAGDL